MKKVWFLVLSLIMISSLVATSSAFAINDEDGFLGIFHSKECVPDKGYQINSWAFGSSFRDGLKYLKKIGDIDLCEKGLLPGDALKSFKPGQRISLTYLDKNDKIFEDSIELMSFKMYKDQLFKDTKEILPLLIVGFLNRANPQPSLTLKYDGMFVLTVNDGQEGSADKVIFPDKTHPLSGAAYLLYNCTLFLDHEDSKRLVEAIKEGVLKYSKVFTEVDYNKFQVIIN